VSVTKLIYEKRDRIAFVTINRPEARNAIDPDVHRLMIETWADFAEDDSVDVAIVTGAGDAFCSGADLKTYIPPKIESATPADIREIVELGLNGFTRGMHRIPKPIIAAVNGWALAGGLETALACDIRIAAEDAQLGQPEIKLGLLPGGGGTQRLPRVVGPGRAALMNMGGDPISGQQAYDWGLVDRVVPREGLLEAALEIAGTLAERSPHALAVVKELARETRDLPIAEGLRREAKAFARCLASEDGREGVAAFLEKRRPQWSGR
jgi:enoyl-CoA hydratase/carnithine racemase